MQNQGITASAVIVSFLLLVLVIGGGLAGCPYYKVWERKMAGQAELQYQQGARQALIAQAAAEDEAAIKRAEAATRRVLGWTDAAKRGCEALGRPGDRACEEQLVRDAATYSIANVWRTLTLYAEDAALGPSDRIAGGSSRFTEALAASLAEGTLRLG
ncbi:MAG: hypothetical protein ACK4OJ_12820, partial [Brevundimonas sp.]